MRLIDKMAYAQGSWDKAISNTVDSQSYTISLDMATSSAVESLETTVNKIKKEVENLKKENNKDASSVYF